MSNPNNDHIQKAREFARLAARDIRLTSGKIIEDSEFMRLEYVRDQTVAQAVSLCDEMLTEAANTDPEELAWLTAILADKVFTQLKLVCQQRILTRRFEKMSGHVKP